MPYWTFALFLLMGTILVGPRCLLCLDHLLLLDLHTSTGHVLFSMLVVLDPLLRAVRGISAFRIAFYLAFRGLRGLRVLRLLSLGTSPSFEVFFHL